MVILGATVETPSLNRRRIQMKINKQNKPQEELKTLFMAELFSKLSSESQDIIVEQIISLLDNEAT